MDFLYEECSNILDSVSAKKKVNLYKTISISLFCLSGIWLYFACNGFDWKNNNPVALILLSFLPIAIFVFLAIFFWINKNKFYVEYDYILISGSIRISKIINNVKRREVLTFETRDIEKLGMLASKTYDRYENYNGIIIKFLTQNTTPTEDKDFYYMVVNSNAQKYLLVFECTKTFIVNVLKFSSNKIIEEGFSTK